MSIHSGSLAITRYRTPADNKPSIKKLNDCLRAKVRDEIRLDGILKELDTCWAKPIGVETDNDGVYWDLADSEVAGSYLLRMRIERRKVSSELLLHIFKTRLADLQQEKKLNRHMQKELKENIRLELMERTLPQLSYLEGLWDPQRGELLVFRTGKKNCELFVELFQTTFAKALNCSIVKMTPPLLGIPDQDWQAPKKSIEFLEPLEKLVPSDLLFFDSNQVELRPGS